MVGETGKETPDAADAHADSQRQHEGVAAGTRHVRKALGDLHAEHAAQQRPDDGLALEQVPPVRELRKRGQRVIQPIRQLRADRRSNDGAGRNSHDRVVAAQGRRCIANPLPQEHAKSDRVGQRLENEVGAGGCRRHGEASCTGNEPGRTITRM